MDNIFQHSQKIFERFLVNSNEDTFKLMKYMDKKGEELL